MEVLKNYINGKWVESSSEDLLNVENPATTEVIAKVPISTNEEINEAVESAKKAFKTWKDTPPTKRVSYLFKLKELMEEHQDELARIITTEHGKIYKEAFLEVGRAIDNIEVACGIPSLMQGNILENINRDIDEYFIRVPIGVFAVIPAFNFPAMIPFWFLPYAVACGNTYIVKPSEITPLTQQKIFELIDKSNFPPGVINLLNGDKTVAEALIEHPDVAGISSVTSTPVARYIYHKAAKYGKRVQCQAGAKNFAVIMPDADIESSLPNILRSAYGNSGQRCLAISNIITVGESHELLREKLIEGINKLKVGMGLDDSVDMGPVISAQAKARIESYIELGIEEGAELVIDGRNITVPRYEKGYFIGPTLFDNVTVDMKIAKEEIFGPVLNILRADDLDNAIEIIHQIDYGNAAVIYTTSGKNARYFQNRTECGNIGVNIGVAAPIACFPFCGMKESFFGDIHGQSMDAINFFTHKKVIITRWY